MDNQIEDPDASPFNRLPPLVVALAVIFAGIEGLFQLGALGMIGGPEAVGWRLGAWQNFGWHEEIWAWMVGNQYFPLTELKRLVTYPFLHGDAVHAILVIVFVLALGKMVAEQFGQLAFLLIFWISAVFGAMAMVLLTNSTGWLVGGYPGAYGLIGAFTFLLWARLTAAGEQATRAFLLIALLAGVQLIFSLINGDFGTLAAELGGFACGFFLSFLVRPGGGRALLDRLRQR